MKALDRQAMKAAIDRLRAESPARREQFEDRIGREGFEAAGRSAAYSCQRTSLGNPGGSPEATRRAFNKRFLLDLAEDWQQHGREVFKRVRRESPAAYLKVCAMLVPKEVKLEHSTSAIKEMTDEELEQAIQAIRAMLAAQAEETKIIEATAEPTALPAPHVVPDRPNKLMDAANTAVGPRERKPHKVPSPPGA